MSHVVWNVDGQRGDLGLYRLHGGLRGFALGFLPAGERRKRDLDVRAGEAEGAPSTGESRVITRSSPTTLDKKETIPASFMSSVCTAFKTNCSENSSFCHVRESEQNPGQVFAPTPKATFFQAPLKHEEDQV